MKKLKIVFVLCCLSFKLLGQSISVEPNKLYFNPILYLKPFNKTDPSLELISTHPTFNPSLSLRHNNNFIGTLTGDVSYNFRFYTNKGFRFQTNISSTYVTALSILPNGNIGVGTVDPTTKLEVDGFTKLGAEAPAIKVKKFTGNTVSTTGDCSTTITLTGITDSKILDFSVLIDWGTNDWVKSGYTISTDPDEEFHVYHKDNEIRICLTTTNSNSLKNKPYKVLVTYEE